MPTRYLLIKDENLLLSNIREEVRSFLKRNGFRPTVEIDLERRVSNVFFNKKMPEIEFHQKIVEFVKPIVGINTRHSILFLHLFQGAIRNGIIKSATLCYDEKECDAFLQQSSS